MRKYLLSLTACLLSLSLFVRVSASLELPVPDSEHNNPAVQRALETFEAAKAADYNDAVYRSKINSLVSRLEELKQDFSKTLDPVYKKNEIKRLESAINALKEEREPYRKKAEELRNIANEANVYAFIAFYDVDKKTYVPGTKVELCRSGRYDTWALVTQHLGEKLANKYRLADSESTSILLENDVNKVVAICLTLNPVRIIKKGQVAPTGEQKKHADYATFALSMLVAGALFAYKKLNRIDKC